MKFSTQVSSSRRKARKAHFSSDSETRHKILSATLSKELRAEHKVRFSFCLGLPAAPRVCALGRGEGGDGVEG
jgi:hypothetical protein